MTARYLAIDYLDGEHDLPDHGLIRGVGVSVAALHAGGLDHTVYTVARNRVATIDDTAAGWDPLVEPGWYLTTESGAKRVQRARPRSETGAAKHQFNLDLRRFRNIYAQADLDLQELLVWERTDRREVAGHSWVEDLLHGWMIPWTRRCVATAEAYRALLVQETPDATDLANAKTAWREALHGPDSGARAGFGYIREIETLGVKTWYGAADRSTTVWRATALLTGLISYATDADTGGWAAGSQFTVSYPDGQSVATWPMRASVLAVEEIA